MVSHTAGMSRRTGKARAWGPARRRTKPPITELGRNSFLNRGILKRKNFPARRLRDITSSLEAPEYELGQVEIRSLQDLYRSVYEYARLQVLEKARIFQEQQDKLSERGELYDRKNRSNRTFYSVGNIIVIGGRSLYINKECNETRAN